MPALAGSDTYRAAAAPNTGSRGVAACRGTSSLKVKVLRSLTGLEKDACVTNHLLSAAGATFSPRALGNARRARHALAAFVVEATAMYRLGGFLGIVLGVSTSILTYQIRRLGR